MNVAVFLGAQQPKNPKYAEIVSKIGEMIGKKGHTLIFGGSNAGLMSVVCNSAKDNGAHVIGVAPEFFKDIANPRCDELEVVPNMGIRKQRMAELSDIFVIVPGGFGTLEEAADAMSWKRMGIIRGKTVFLNHEGFYEPIKTIMKRMIEDGFVKDTVLQDVLFVDVVEELERYL